MRFHSTAAAVWPRLADPSLPTICTPSKRPLRRSAIILTVTGRGTREVGGLGTGPHGDGHVPEPGTLGVALAQPGPGDLQMTHLAHRGADHPGKCDVRAGQIVPDHPALLVGVSAKRHMLVLTRDQVEDLHAIAAGPDMVVAENLHLQVRAQAAVIPQRQAGILS